MVSHQPCSTVLWLKTLTDSRHSTALSIISNARVWGFLTKYSHSICILIWSSVIKKVFFLFCFQHITSFALPLKKKKNPSMRNGILFKFSKQWGNKRNSWKLWQKWCTQTGHPQKDLFEEQIFYAIAQVMYWVWDI